MHLSYVIFILSFFVHFHGAHSQAKWGEFGKWSTCKFSSQDRAKVENRIQLCQLDGKTVSPNQCRGPPMGETRTCMNPTGEAVVGGWTAEVYKYPSQAFIELDNGDNQCGGSYIGGEWILTAAHCFDNNQKATRISLGSNNRYAQNGQNLTVEKTCCHKDYNSANLEHDICLVKMTHRPFPSPAINLIQMTTDTSYPDEGTACRVVGWGYDEFRNLPDELLEANVSAIDKATCDASYKSIGNTLPKNTICAGNLEGGADTCGGDSGGPLFCKHNGKWTLFGVTSQGHHECGIKNFPGIYTKVADYVPWVDETKKTSCETGFHWGDWIKTCSVTCGEGIEEMVRECFDAENKKTDATNCDGSPNTLGKCNPGICPEYHWGEWTRVCGVTCGEGIEISFRTCLNAKDMPAPEENCDGESQSTGTCNPGSCQERVNPCSSDPCQNGGSCTRLSSTIYRCRCTQGYSGTNCETETFIDPCSSRPCRNGGICTRLSASNYQCQCSQGYTGDNCELEIIIDPCSSKPCQNGGICTRLSETSYQCQCRQGFSGNQCQTEITTVAGEFCFKVRSRDGLGSQFFSSVFNSFRDNLSVRLRSFSGFRRMSTEGSSTGDNLEVTVRIQATTDNGRTKQGVENDLSRIIETSSLRTGLGGKPETCGKVPDTKPEEEKYCVQITTSDVTGNDVKLINIRTDLQSNLRTFPGFEKVDFDTSFETGSIKMTVTVSTSNKQGGSNLSEYLQFLVQRSAQTNGITDNPTSCTETPTPRNPCSPNPCQNEGTCFPQGTADYYCRCRPRFSGKSCETARVVTRTQNFCFEMRSVTPNARNLFSAFGRQIQTQLATFNGYRGVELGAQTRGFSGSEEIIITTRIQAVPTAGKTRADVNTSLMKLVETSARNSGIFGSVTNCNAA